MRGMRSPWGGEGGSWKEGKEDNVVWSQREGKSPSGECKSVGVALSRSEISRPSGKGLRETAVVLGDGT